jgi:hypothetical protein
LVVSGKVTKEGKNVISRRKTNLLRLAIILFSTLTSYSLHIPLVAKAKQNQASIIRPSNILDNVRNKMKKQPNISPKELVAYANKLLEEKGFDYNFDVCEAIGSNRLRRISSASPSRISYSYKMAQSVGRNITLRFISENPGDAPCGECFSPIPSLQVTKQEMLIVSGGQRYRLKRPAVFGLDEAELVDETMKKVLRTWQLPYQTIPVGISPDGTKLYLEFYVEHEIDTLVLELSENGSAQFKVRSDVDLLHEGEWVENHPKDPTNAYLSFLRFYGGGKSYVIKFSAPCT